MTGLATFEAEALDTIEFLSARGDTSSATIVRVAYGKFLARLREIADIIAGKAREYIVEEERSTRVRPDTQGAGGPRLEDFIGISEPVPEVEGSVAINDEHILADNVSWWWTNEEGYYGFVDEERQGFFFNPGSGSGFIPSSQMSREHAIFRPYGGKAPTMVIHNPIPERRFVLHGYDRVAGEWHAMVREAKAEFVAALRRANILP